MEIPQVSGQIQRHQDFGFTVPHRPVSSNNPSALKRADRDLGQRSKSFVQTSQVYECLLATLVDVVDGGLAQRKLIGPASGGSRMFLRLFCHQVNREATKAYPLIGLA